MILIAASMMSAFAAWSQSDFGSDSGLSSGLTVSDAGSDWTADGTVLTASATTTYTANTASCGDNSSTSTTSTSTLTITNDSGYSANLIFSVGTTNSGTVSYSGSASSDGTVTLANGGSIKITGTSVSDVSATTTCSFSVSITSFAVATPYNVEFSGDMTATQDGEDIAIGEVVALQGLTIATLTANETNDDGETFLYWCVNGKAVSSSTTYDWTVVGSETSTTSVYPYYGNAEELYYSGDDICFDDLQAALDSSSVVTVIANVTLLEDTEYTVPVGTTLLVPRTSDDTGSLVTVTSHVTIPKIPYVEMTVPSGTTIDVYGTLIVSSRYGTDQNKDMGFQIGEYGEIVIEDGGNINIKSGALLNCYGTISGDGMVTAESGSDVYELLQIADFRGGSATSSIYNTVFPMTTYYIQNIQSDFKIVAGAECHAYWYLYVNSTGYTGEILYIDNSTSAESMFHLMDGYVIRSHIPYDGTSDSDKIVMDLYGTMNSGSLTITQTVIFYSVYFKSSTKDLPILGNMCLKVADGSVFNMNHSYKLLPGAEILIDEGGTLNINSSGSLYLYHDDDYDDLYSYGGYARRTYYSRDVLGASTYSRWSTGGITINGLLNVDGGAFYTSTNPGVISGTGVISYANDASTTSSTGTTITEYYNNSDYAYPSFFKANLLGSDGEYFTPSNSTVYKGTEDGAWYEKNGTIAAVENTTAEVDDGQIAVDVVITPQYSVADATFVSGSITFDSDDMTVNSVDCADGVTYSTTDSPMCFTATGVDFVADEAYTLATIVFDVDEDYSSTVEVSALVDGYWAFGDYNISVYASRSYTLYRTYYITYDQEVQDDWITSYTIASDDITLPVLEAKNGAEFLGWSEGDGTEPVSTIDVSEVASDLTLTAVWDMEEYTITYSESVDDDAVTSFVETDSTITLPVLENTEEYDFDGWYVTDDETQTIITTIEPSTAQDYSLTAKWSAITVEPDAGTGGTTSGTTDETDSTTEGTGDYVSDGDTIEVDVATDGESEETVALAVSIITNETGTVGESSSSDETESAGYNALAEDTQMIVLSVVVEDADEFEAPSETATTNSDGDTFVEGYYYNGEPMYYSSLYQAYVYIFDEEEGFDASLVTVGEAIVLEYDGDIYGDGEVTAFDVTRIYRLAMGDWSDGYDVVDMQSRLEADVNGDGKVDVNDALYVLQSLWD